MTTPIFDQLFGTLKRNPKPMIPHWRLGVRKDGKAIVVFRDMECGRRAVLMSDGSVRLIEQGQSIEKACGPTIRIRDC